MTYGQDGGNEARNLKVFLPSLDTHAVALLPAISPAPPSPEANRMEIPRAPSWAKPLQTRLA